MAASPFAKTDKILRRKGLRHLLSSALLRREESVFSELTALRQDILGRRFMKSSAAESYEQVKRRGYSSAQQRQVQRVQFVPVASGAIFIDMSQEHEARRRERILSAELARIDALWRERASEIRTNRHR